MDAGQHYSFWERETFLAPCDLIIVGAGITGLSAGLFFKRNCPDARVMVMERGLFPTGASTRNAGFACLGSITEHLSDLEKESESHVKDRIRRRYEGLRLLKKELGEGQMGYDPCGGYELFRSTASFQKATAEMDRFNRWMEEITGQSLVYEARELEGYPMIYNRLEGALHPGRMMQALIRRAVEQDVEIKWGVRVQQIEEEGVRLDDGSLLTASRVLVAANGFSHRLLPDIGITPARGLVLVTNELKQLPWKGTFHHDRGYIYFRNIGSRLLIGGARNVAEEEEETDQFGINSRIERELIRFVSRVLRLQEGWQVEQRWSGIMGFTASKTPILRRVNSHCYVAAGLSGMGVALGMEVGRRAARMIES
ncbi:NAD(P)/FAD-dependent oxidoreductase [Fodinibius sediminis]|uniref:FAD dependent oxidoreductase domain-containing protein n=1 Tax=Fodinibius sediminis TaxID=1214077 RepID=A0A521EYH1_9BACT|nr:FAD-dependent oxidoreductase [Fodinibius sediminis]SMO88876.1 hypothetical protein SAMN06265218_12036 [Fodinibius sediminis]